MKKIKIFESKEKATMAIPNQSSRLIIIGERKICVMNHGEQFYGFEDRCPHMGASLSQGIVNYLGEVICPLHEYRFRKSGEEVNGNCESAQTLPIEIEKDGVYIYINN